MTPGSLRCDSGVGTLVTLVVDPGGVSIITCSWSHEFLYIYILFFFVVFLIFVVFHHHTKRLFRIRAVSFP